ncbi:hypothetical protein ACRAWD_15880 [Caulobacter segnis]
MTILLLADRLDGLRDDVLDHARGGVDKVYDGQLITGANVCSAP